MVFLDKAEKTNKQKTTTSPADEVGRGRGWRHWNRSEKARPKTPQTPCSKALEASDDAKTTSR